MEGIYPQVPSDLLSKFAPWDVNSPALLGGVTYPEKIRNHAFWCDVSLWVQK